MQIHELEVLAQTNEVLTRSNMAVMVQFAEMNVTMNSMHAQLKTLTLEQTNKKG